MQRFASRMLFFMIMAGLILAPAASFAANGSAVGRVSDKNSGDPLPGANIVLEGTQFGDATGRGGSFHLKAVPEGTYTLHVSYLGFEEYTESITITTGKPLRLDIELTSSFLEGDEVVFVGGQRSGQARALNQQRTAENIMNVVASDQIGSFPDPNVAEALQRIPAIAIQRDQGEGRYVTIRGTEPNLSNVMINNQRIPSPEGDVRQVALDVIPADALSSIEVSKTLSADMDGDAVGGSINLVTRSPLNQERAIGSVTLGGGYNALTSGPIAQSAFAYGTRLGAKRNIGLMLTGSYYRTARGSDNIEMEYDNFDFEDGVERESIKEIQLRDYMVTRERTSLGATIDYAWNNNNRHSFNVLWNEFGDQEYRRRTVFVLDEGSYDSRTGSVDQISGAEIEKELKDRYEVQRIYSVGGQGEHKLMDGKLELDYNAAYSYAEESEPEANYFTWKMEDVNFALNSSDPDVPRFSPSNGSSFGQVNNAANYAFDEASREDNLTTDDEIAGGANLLYHLALMGNPTDIKAGVKVRSKSKDRKNKVIEYGDDRDDDDPSYVPWTMDEVSENFDAGDYLNGDYDGYDVGLNTDPDKGDDFFSRHSGDLEAEEDIETNLGESYNATETVTAAYLMATHRYGPQFLFVGGVRMEMTNIDYNGNEVDLDNETITRRNATNDYTNILPSFSVRYAFDDRTNFRAAYSNSIARPSYFDLVPYRIFSDDDEEVSVGNPNLEAAYATNIDLLGERYFQSIGLLSAGVFFKSIDHYMYENVRENAAGYEITQVVNATETGTLTGFEFAWNQQLSFLPGHLDGLGLYTNYTYTTSSIDFRLPDGTVRNSVLPGQSENMLNFAVGYEKFGFSGRLSLTYNGKQILSVGEDEASDEWIDNHMQLDFTASQRVWNNLRVYADVMNLTGEPYVVYIGDEDHPIQREFYSTWMHVGLKYEF